MKDHGDEPDADVVLNDGKAVENGGDDGVNDDGVDDSRSCIARASDRPPAVHCKDDIVASRKALFQSVEGFLNDSKTLDDDLNDKNSDENANNPNTTAFNCIRNFVQLFDNANTTTQSKQNNKARGSGNHHPPKWNPICPHRTLREQRKLLFDMIQNYLNPKNPNTQRFFRNLQGMVQHVIGTIEDWYANRTDHDDDNSYHHDKTEKITPALLFQFLLHVTEVIQVYINGIYHRRQQSKNQKPKVVSISSEVYEIVLLLHNAVIEYVNYTSAMKDTEDTNTKSPTTAICNSLVQKILLLCESCWTYNVTNCESVIVNVLPILVQWALDHTDNYDTNDKNNNHYKGRATNSHSIMKRLYQIRTSIQAIDFQNEDSTEFLSLLLQLVSLPHCLNAVEGKRLLSYLLGGVDKTLMYHVHQAIKVQIPNNRVTLLNTYSEIYYRAYMDYLVISSDDEEANSNDSDDDDDNSNISKDDKISLRSEFETCVLQDLAYSVIHVSNQQMVKSLLRILQPFHDMKKDQQGERLLYRIYNPIIWRSLTATNAMVRWNATQVFGEIFPLQYQQQQYPNNYISTNDAILKGSTILHSTILQDRDHRVRIAGLHCFGKLATIYWDIIPSTELYSLLNCLMEHASDTSAAAVRVSALNTMTLLLDIQAARGVLRPLVPKLGNLIHDKVEKVRCACVRMLLRIKQIQGIKYYHVVPVDHLTARLAEEGRRNPTNTVASLITGLMLNSYIPQNVHGDEQINRTIKFITTDPIAARVFYANVSEYLSVNEVSKLAAMLLRCVNTSVVAEQKRMKLKKSYEPTTKLNRSKRNRNRTVIDDEDTYIDEDANKSFLLKVSIVADIAEVICILLQSIEKDLSNHEDCIDFLQNEFGGSMLTNTLSHYENLLGEKLAFSTTTSSASNDSMESPDHEGYHRICTAILRCAGTLPSHTVDGLTAHITLVLRQISNNDVDCSGCTSVGEEIFTNTANNVSAHVAVLCLWGFTDTVASSISASIESPFETDHDLLLGSPCANTKKRKSGRKPKSAINKDDNDTIMPKLPAMVALNVLGDILCGIDPSSVAARELLLNSNVSRHSIEKALERGIRHAEKVLAADLIYSQSVSESDINYIINVCECYGRFTLHKEASTTGCLEFSIQAEKLLNWTTLKIIPACRLSTTTMNTTVDEPFLDLNISSIAVEQSFVGYSPVVTGPPRRRTNLSRTPDKLGDASGIFNPRLSTNHERHHEGACVLGGSVAVALLQSSCVVFSEWLTVGGSGSETIAMAAAEWCHVFDSTETDNSIESELLPAFCRLASEVFMSGSDVSLLKALLLKCKDPDSAGTIKSLISSLLSSRTAVHDTSIMTRIVECILSAAHDVRGAEFQSVSNIAEVPKTFAAMFKDNKLTKSCTSSALEAILESRLACIELAKLTIRNIKSGYEAEDHSIVMFNALCLQILCDGAHGNSKVVNDVTDMVRAIDFDAIIDKSTNVLHPFPGDDAGKILKAIKIAIDAK